MSHELRTPLNSILGFSDVLSGIETLTDKQRRWVGNIQNSGRVLLEMINDILDLAKIEAGKMEVRPSSFDLLSVIRAQMELFRKMAEDKNIDLQIDSSLDELRINQDQGKISQILTNLISNAIKFTPANGRILVAAEMDGKQMVITVSDTGIGIAEEDIPVALAVFGQVHREQSHEGTGLGLPLAKMFTELHGGTLQLTSTIGKGTTVTLTFPASRVIQAGG